MKTIAALTSAVLAIAVISCGKSAPPQSVKPVQEGKLEQWLRDPKNYKPFYYNEKQKPGSSTPEFRYLVTKTPFKVSVDSMSNEFSADADLVIVLREAHKYQAFMATYLNCAAVAAKAFDAEAAPTTAPDADKPVAAEKPAAVAAVESDPADLLSADKATTPATLQTVTESEADDLATTFTNAAAYSKLRRGVLIGYQELGASGGGLDWNANSGRLNLVGLGYGTKTLEGKRDLGMILYFDENMRKSGLKDAASLSVRRHLKSYEELHNSPPRSVTKLADAQERLRKDCGNTDADVFKFDSLPAPNPTPGPTPPIRHGTHRTHPQPTQSPAPKTGGHP